MTVQWVESKEFFNNIDLIQKANGINHSIGFKLSCCFWEGDIKFMNKTHWLILFCINITLQWTGHWCTHWWKPGSPGLSSLAGRLPSSLATPSTTHLGTFLHLQLFRLLAVGQGLSIWQENLTFVLDQGFWKEKRIFILNHHERGHFHPHRSGRRPNGKCLLVGVAYYFFCGHIVSFHLDFLLATHCTYFSYEACPLRELYCLEHGIHPDGSIPAEYQVAS